MDRRELDAGPFDVLVLGSGVAGLSVAVRLCQASPRLRVAVLTKGDLSQSTTRWAQGGVAAVLGADEDSTDLHLADTLEAGAGLCDAAAARVLVDEGPSRVEELIALGARFDKEASGSLSLAREGGHSRARVLHAGGAATGAEVERALVAATVAGAAAVLERWFALDLLVDDGRCRGVRALGPGGAQARVLASHVVLATGGAGQLYSVTTNPPEATGDGVAMALRAGVPVADLEFVQFHPTALHHPLMPRPLLSEALRGHGAVLRDEHGERFCDELAPRDVVSRAMAEVMAAHGVDHLWLDASALERFGERFPTIAASLAEVGLDPARDWLPVAPAAHHMSGGVVTDLWGATALGGCWAAGEVACTGVHGANRLASNSLLEGMVFGARVAEAIAGGDGAGRDRSGGDGAGGDGSGGDRSGGDGAGGDGDGGVLGALRAGDAAPPDIPVKLLGRPVAGTADPRDRDAARMDDVSDAIKARVALQSAMTAGAGVVRSAASIDMTRVAVDGVAAALAEMPPDVASRELANLADVARALLAAAGAREESRGAHTRADFPGRVAGWRCRQVVVDVRAGADVPGMDGDPLAIGED